MGERARLAASSKLPKLSSRAPPKPRDSRRPERRTGVTAVSEPRAPRCLLCGGGGR